ncbi:MAG: D-alanine--D-alanine ligase family protein [Planctomycetota bacterium]|jgi:D-alanine--D-alanine ligase
MKRKRVAVVMGGVSPEHDISIKSGATILAHLDPERFEALTVKIDRDGTWCLAEGIQDPALLAGLAQGLRPEHALARLKDWNLDVAFLALHGPCGEDGSIQGFFQSAGIPYTGSGVEASAACMNKDLAKMLVARCGVRLPPAMILSRQEWERSPAKAVTAASRSMSYPLYVKTLRSGSSIGVHRVTDEEALERSLKDGFTLDHEVMIEQGIPGIEVTCGVMGSPVAGYRALPPVEIRPKASFFDFTSKYDPEKADELCPAPIGEEACKQVQEAAEAISRRIGTRGIVRIDFILSQGELWFLEVNTIPGFTPESIVLKEAIAAGMTITEMIDKLIHSALEEHAADARSGRSSRKGIEP